MAANLLYQDVYNDYKELIEANKLKKGDRMPSLRECCNQRSVSKTTAETAYFQLVADGYIVSRERSGYYVAGINRSKASLQKSADTKTEFSLKYDFSKIGEDPDIFCFDLWQRYMKSAMRDTRRMISYGQPQGEEELRTELASYVKKRRNIYCNPDNIVVGASTQSLLMLLLALLQNQGMNTASVPSSGFKRYSRVFDDFGFSVGIRKKESDVIYVSPAHMTQWGEVMPLSRRYEILEHSKNGHLIIEDDYMSELNYSKQACPSVYALSGGENVVYLGSFSRVLLPSIRISFMILPEDLMPGYNEVKDLYDQTASKTEQLALCQFLRDDQLARHIRKVKRHYGDKRDLLKQLLLGLNNLFPESNMLLGDSGTEAALRIKKTMEPDILNWLHDHDINCKVVAESEDSALLLFSCGIVSTKNLLELVSSLINNTFG